MIWREHQLLWYVYVLSKKCNNDTNYLSSHISLDPSTASFHYLLIHLRKNHNPVMTHSTSKTCCYDVQNRHPEADSHLWKLKVQGCIKTSFVCSCKHDSNFNVTKIKKLKTIVFMSYMSYIHIYCLYMQKGKIIFNTNFTNI